MSSGRQELLGRIGKFGRQVRDPGRDLVYEREEEARQEMLREYEAENSPSEVYAEAEGAVLEHYGVEGGQDVRAEGVSAIDQAILAANEKALARVEARSLSPEERQAKLNAQYLAAELKPTQQAAPESSADAIIDALTPPAEELDADWLEAEDDAVYEDEAGQQWTAEDDGWKPYTDAA